MYVLSAIGAGLVCIAFPLISMKWRIGFVLNFLGSLCLAIHFVSHDWSMAFLNAFFMVVCVNGWIQFGRK